jgi:hypothetical protein
MITDKDIAELCVGSYGTPAISWDFWEDGTTNDGVKYGVKIIDGIDVIILPGSEVMLDWRRDLDTFPETATNHPQLGQLHTGFYTGMEQTWQKIKSRNRSKRIGGAHSLGASRLRILAGLAVIDQQPPIACITFGEPKAGMQQLADITKSVSGRTYRNGGTLFHDPVTDVPYFLPPKLLFIHDREFTLVSNSPPSDDEWGFFSYHHIPLYAEVTPATLIVS